MKKLIIASGNPGKLREIARILEPLAIEAAPQSDFGVPECPEPHVTFIENCLAKARHASAHTGLPALADDSGICVEALNGAPACIPHAMPVSRNPTRAITKSSSPPCRASPTAAPITIA